MLIKIFLIIMCLSARVFAQTQAPVRAYGQPVSDQALQNLNAQGLETVREFNGKMRRMNGVSASEQSQQRSRNAIPDSLKHATDALSQALGSNEVNH